MKRNDARQPTRAFGAAVRSARIRQQISQAELAEKCDLDQTYISGIERGVRNPTVLSIWRIASALQIRPSALFLEAEQMLYPEDGKNGEKT